MAPFSIHLAPLGGSRYIFIFVYFLHIYIYTYVYIVMHIYIYIFTHTYIIHMFHDVNDISVYNSRMPINLTFHCHSDIDFIAVDGV